MKRATISEAKDHLSNLERRGIVRLPTRPARAVLPSPIELPDQVSLLDALLRERDEAPW